MKTSLTKKQIIIAAALILVLGILSGCIFRQFPLPTQDPTEATQGAFTNEVTHDEQYMRKLDYILTLIEQRHIDGLDYDKLEDLLAQAVIDATGDRWSYYLDAESYQKYLEQFNNAYVGIGVTIQASANEQKGPFLIAAVTSGGPAEEAGLQVGDTLTAVDGNDTSALTLAETQKLVRGTEGTTVKLTILRGGQTLELTVTRRTIRIPVVSYEMLDGNIGYIKISNFDTNCAAETIAAVDDLRARKAEGIVFDLRFNPGGMKNELVKILDYLLPEGPLFRSVDYTGKESVDYSDANFVDLPFAVLVNGDSYSAAEFFAAAIQEYEAGVVIGTKTCGKANYQQTYQLPDGSAVGVSTGHYQTPKGVTLKDIGVTPDYPVEVDDETYSKIYYGQLDKADDEQLKTAVSALRERIDRKQQ